MVNLALVLVNNDKITMNWISEEEMRAATARFFPDDYVVGHVNFYKEGFKLAGSFNQKITNRIREILIKEEKESVNNLANLEINLAGVPFFLLLKNFHLYQPEKQKAKSPGSQAIYPARSANKMNGLLLQYLPPHSQTSCHFHQIKTEIYHSLAGEAFIEIDQAMTVKLMYAGSRVIFPRTIHQVKTANKPSLILIEVLGDPEGLSMADHVYV